MPDRLDDGALLGAIAQQDSLIREAVAYVHAHPELAHAERDCATYLGGRLEALGCHVERGVAGMETAFRATLTGSGPGRTVGLAALYDAVPAVPAEGGLRAVHSCGHGPIAAGVIGAIAALAEHREQLDGTIVVMGCPADEIHAPGTVARGGGKALSAAAGAWDDIDAALYAHPESIDTAWTASMWMRREVAHVSGSRGLSEGAPEPVLDAALAAIESVRSLPRAQAMLEHFELDGDVESGGGLVATATFLLWAEREAGLDELSERLRAGVAAEWSSGSAVPSIAPDAAVRACVAQAISATGRSCVDHPPALPFATDFGVVTRRVPAALVGVGRAEGWAFHTPAGEQQFATKAGIEAARGIAEVLALAASRLTTAR